VQHLQHLQHLFYVRAKLIARTKKVAIDLLEPYISHVE